MQFMINSMFSLDYYIRPSAITPIRHLAAPLYVVTLFLKQTEPLTGQALLNIVHCAATTFVHFPKSAKDLVCVRFSEWELMLWHRR